VACRRVGREFKSHDFNPIAIKVVEERRGQISGAAINCQSQLLYGLVYKTSRDPYQWMLIYTTFSNETGVLEQSVNHPRTIYGNPRLISLMSQASCGIWKTKANQNFRLAGQPLSEQFANGGRREKIVNIDDDLKMLRNILERQMTRAAAYVDNKKLFTKQKGIIGLAPLLLSREIS
jgi:hypothetical protein